MIKCKWCNKLHDKADVKRKLGEFHAAYELGFCSANCYTQYIFKSEKPVRKK